MIINIVVGDWSHDGHGWTDSFPYETNLSRKEVEEAYNRGVDIVGVDITEYCQNYEDFVLPEVAGRKLEAAGFIFTTGDIEWAQSSDGYRNAPGWIISPEFYAAAYVFITSKGDINANFEPVQIQNVHAGGYGLFAS